MARGQLERTSRTGVKRTWGARLRGGSGCPPPPIPSEKRRLRLPARPSGSVQSTAQWPTAARAPLATEAFSPRPLRTVLDDVRRRCCATGDARPAHARTRVETGRFEPRHVPERMSARLAFLAFMTTYRDRASARHERCRRTKSRVDSARGRRSSRRSTVESRDAYGVERGARHGSGSSPVAQQRCRTSCEDRAKRPREKTSSRETASSDRRPLCS